MVHINASRIAVLRTTKGTNNFGYGMRFDGYRRFANVMANGDTCFYVARDGARFETGIGRAAGRRLVRQTVLERSTGRRIDFVNNPTVWMVQPGAAVRTMPRWIPVRANFSWYNQGRRTIEDTSRGMIMPAPRGSGPAGLEQAMRSTAYTLDMTLRYTGTVTQTNSYGFYIRDSNTDTATGFIIVLDETADNPIVLQEQAWTSDFTLSRVERTTILPAQPRFFRMVDDLRGTLTIWIGFDGSNYIEVVRLARGRYDRTGFMSAVTSGPDGVLLVRRWRTY